MGLLPFDKWARAIKIMAANGGPIGSVMKLWRTDTLKLGKCVGTDVWGNKYFMSNYYMIGRSRWVEFNPRFKFEYDASQINAAWFGWLHYKTDKLPSQDEAKQMLNRCCWAQCWVLPHEENLTGTSVAYYPYRTTVHHITIWDGKTVCDRLASEFKDEKTKCSKK